MAIYRFQPNTPIPNNPFYYPPTDSLSTGGGSPLIVGAGLYINYATGTIESLAAINVVTSVTGILPIVVNGSVTEPIVQVESATSSSLGVVRVGDNIDVSTGIISVKSASTSDAGVVRLNDTLTSFSLTEALTANQGRVLSEEIASLASVSNLILAGTINASTGLISAVTNAGSSSGFTLGSPLPTPSLSINNYYVVVSVAGSYSPPSGGGPYNAVVGDYFICDGSAWVYLAVGYTPPAATETNAGVVELATAVETEAGADGTRAVTPLGAGATYIKKTTLAGKGQLISATGTATPINVLPGLDNQYLTACAACPSGLTWSAPASEYLPCAIITGKGVIVTGTAPNVAAALPLGTSGQYLAVNTACSTGLEWVTNTDIGCSFITNKGTIIVGCSPNFPAPLAVGGNGCILTANSACTLGVAWAPNTAIPCATITGKGAIVTGSASSTPSALPVGADGSLLTANSLCSTGLSWIPNPYIPCSTLTTKGSILTATSSSSPAALPPGVDGYYLRVNSACPCGLEWDTGAPASGAVTSITAGDGLTGGTITTSGTIAIAPTGISQGTYYYASFTVGTDGRITAASSNFPVTCITAGDGLCGGTITCMGTICMPSFPGVQGCWVFPTIYADDRGRITSISSGSAVTCVCTGVGLTGGPISTTGTISLQNIGTGGTYTNPTIQLDDYGRVVSASSGSSGGVTCVDTGTGLTGGPITGTGTIALSNTGVTAGTYSFGWLTQTTADNLWSMDVNAQGQVTSMTPRGCLFVRTNEVNGGLGGVVELGQDSGGSSVGGLRNVSVGYQAACNMQGGTNLNADNVTIGAYAGGAIGSGYISACATIAIGTSAAACATDPIQSTIVGTAAGAYGPDYSTLIGACAGQQLLSSSCEVVAVGGLALNNLLCSTRTTAVGTCALFTLAGGAFCGGTALGFGAGINSSGNYNTHIGFCAGYNAQATAGPNIAIGNQAGWGEAGRSISIGCSSGVSGGTCNISIGELAGLNAFSTSCNNIFIGRAATGVKSGEYTDNTLIGFSVEPVGSSVFSGQVVLGNNGCSGYYIGKPSWCTLSDARDKTNIQDTALGLDFVQKIQPRLFTWCVRGGSPRDGCCEIGVIAQEVREAVLSTPCAELLGMVSLDAPEDNEQYTVGATQLVLPLVNAVKELSAENRALRCELTDLKSQLVALGINVQ